ncbi:hypothetical protein Tco_0736286 [Tanacetum coccineum]
MGGARGRAYAIDGGICFDLKGYSDSDYAGCKLDRKSTSGACQVARSQNVYWSAKEQQSVAMSSAKAEYAAAAECCANILWIKNHILKEDIELHFIPTQYQLVDIFTKPLDEPTFKRLIVELGGIREEIVITTFRNALRAHYLPHLRGKTGRHDQISNKDAIILYCLANRVEVDFARLIWEDIIHKPNKKTREKVVPYPSVHNWALKPNKTEGPPFTDHMLAICNAEVPRSFKAPKTSSQLRRRFPKAKSLEIEVDSEENNLQNTHLSPKLRHPNPKLTNEIKKTSPQAASGPPSLGVTSEEGAHPQLSSADSTAEVDPRISAPHDSIPQQ